MWLWVVIGLVVVFILAIVWIFNKFVRLRAMTREGWSGIDVQLKRRYDLVPNLVETVKGYKIYEKDVLTRIVKLRGEAGKETHPEARGQIEGVAVAVAQQPGLAAGTARPDRADGVDHVACRQVVTVSQLDLAGRAAAQQPAGLEQARARRAMNRTVDTTAAEQRRVGGVDDRIQRQRRDVRLQGTQPSTHANILVSLATDRKARWPRASAHRDRPPGRTRRKRTHRGCRQRRPRRRWSESRS
mgnify:CR=1 FL=1